MALLAILVSACGGASAPTSGGSTPVPIELPSLSDLAVPTDITASVSDISSAAGLSLLPPDAPWGASPEPVTDPSIELPLAAISSSSLLQQLQQAGPDNYDRVTTTVDGALEVFAGMECARSSGNTTCEFTNDAGDAVKIDFAPHGWTPSFSDDNIGLSESVTCVDDTGTELTSTTALCMRVWVDGERHLIGVFTTAPTADDEGAGFFISQARGGEPFGAIYDRSDATMASSTMTLLEFFIDLDTRSEDSHYFIAETGSTSSTAVVDLSSYSSSTMSGSTVLSYTGRWARDLEYWYGNLQMEFVSPSMATQSEDGVCTTKAGVRTTGCPSSITGTLAEYLGGSTSTDYTFPSTSIFPESPTF